MLLSHLSKITPALKRITVSMVMALAIAFFCASNGNAATINAASCMQSDVQSAINSASSGDTVLVPSGNCTWSAPVNLNKNITLMGNGSINTKVTWNTTGFAIIATGTWRITGMGFAKGSSGSGIVSIPVDTSSVGWRVDHCDFTSSSTYGESILIFGAPTVTGYGLADNNTHTNMRAVLIYGNDCSPSGDKEWARVLSLGTANAVYVEDSTITNTISQNGYEEFDLNCGGRIVFRYNTVNSFNFGIHSVQGGNRAARSWEIYNNKFIAGSLFPWVVGHVRGGSGVIFNNTVAGSFGSNVFLLDNVRSCESRSSSGICGGSSSWDGNRTGAYGYPCRDQIGRSTDVFQWDGGIPPQTLSPAYFWNNKNNGIEVPAQVSSSCTNQTSYHILANRDFYNYNASFNGTTGVGMGLLANRPATCTTNANESGGGVAYWATDTNTLYRCSATNTWTVHYTPYTYPHPLRQGGDDTSAPALPPPRNLRTIN